MLETAWMKMFYAQLEINLKKLKHYIKTTLIGIVLNPPKPHLRPFWQIISENISGLTTDIHY